MRTSLVVGVAGASLLQGVSNPPSHQFVVLVEPGRWGVDCYIWRLVGTDEVLLKLLHGDWTLLWLGVGKDGADTLSGIGPVEVLEPLGSTLRWCPPSRWDWLLGGFDWLPSGW